MTHDSILELEAAIPRSNVAQNMKRVKQEYGKGLRAQAIEILALARAEGRISPAEYYNYRLFDDQKLSKEQKRQFIGKSVEMKLHRLTGNIDYFGCVDDKFLAYQLLGSLGYPVPESLAIYWQRNKLDELPTLFDEDSVAEFLRKRIEYPWFGKPVTGIRSQGIAMAMSYDASTDELEMSGGKRICISDFVKALAPYRQDGYLFQRVLEPHPTIEKACGDRLTTARVIVILKQSGPEILKTLWKIPVGSNVADNYWRSGNILANVDPGSGEVVRLISGVGLDRMECQEHPDTQCRLLNFTLPDWTAATELCLRIAPIYSKLRMQAFDIALSKDGPVLMEINIGGDYNLPQMITDGGILTPDFRKFLWECARSRGLESVLNKLKIRELS